MDKDIESNRTRITKAALTTHHDIIVQDILGDVIVDLYGKQILTTSEYANIKIEGNSVREARNLLNLLESKGNYAFNQFLNYLSAHYSWLAESIQYFITNAYNDACLTKLHDVLTFGEVPQLSSRHVSRTEHVKALREVLKTLEAGNFVVVVGMAGCGKSSLVIELLNDPLITMQYMEGMVQWIHVGRGNLDVGCIQTEVLNRLNEELISIPINTDYETTKKNLKLLWKQKQLTHSLLILDDVCSNQIVNYLDIGCKILITTHDRSIMDDIVDSRINYMKVNEGFEEIETLNLFSKCLSVDYTSLPSYASKIHNICKGFPLTISLIGAQLEMHKEDTISNTDRWKFYFEELSDKTNEPFKYTRRSYNQFKCLEKAIEMCIKSLPNDLQNKYQDFSLFVYDLNIKPEVLCVLWNLRKIQVEDIMLELINKSLVVRIWNQPLNSYIYSVHDLLLSYLKKMKSQQETEESHRQLIEKYRTYCNGNFANLPRNDNYIFLYFGYHLKNANMLEEFPIWFLNLKFLESKICTTGPADLLADFIKYRKCICVKSDYEEYIKEIEQFVKCIGPNLYQTKCDIVQLGLLEPETSFVYSEAHKIAKLSGKPYFYYNIRASQNCVPKPYISIVRDKIETVIFGKRYDEVLIATESGSIKLWNIMSHKCLYTYFGHTARVTHLMKNKSKDHFLSTSDDTTIRIWKMKSFPDLIEDPEVRSPSPETKQDHWQNAFKNTHYEKPIDVTDCVFTLDSHAGPVIFAQFSSDSKLVVSSSTDKKLKIWKLDNFIRGSKRKLQYPKTINHTSVITKCYFIENKPNDNLFYLTHSQNGSAIHGGKYPFEHFTGLLYLNETILSFLPLPSTNENDEKLLVMTPTKVKCYEFRWARLNRINEYSQPMNKPNYKLFSISEDYKGKQLNNFRYLAFSLSNNTIQICNSLTGYNYLDLNDPVHDILNLDWFLSKEDQTNWLLCAAKDKSIRVWCLKDMTQYTCTLKTSTTHQSNSESESMCKNEVVPLQNYKLFTETQNFFCFKLKQNFDALWLDNSYLLIAAITQCGMLKILFEGMDQWALVDKKVVTLSIVHSERKLDQTMIIVGCTDSSVYSLTLETSTFLFSSCDTTVKQFYTYYDGDVLVVVALLKSYIPNNDGKIQLFQIWSSKNMAFVVNIEQFIDCFVFRDKVIILQKVDEILIFDIKSFSDYTRTDLLAGVSLTNSSIMLDCSTLALTNLGMSLKLYDVNTHSELKKIDEFDLPFRTTELISISVSNNKQFIVLGGQHTVIVFVDIISKTVRHFTTDPSVNIIHSIIWSSDDTRFAIKEPNQIILFDVKCNSKIASMRLTGDKVLADFALKEYIAINTSGKLVKLSLLEQ